MKKQQKSSNLHIAVTVTLITACAIIFDIRRRKYLGNGCIMKALTGIACPACGMTRAFTALLRLDFKAAFYYNPAWFTVPIAALCTLMLLVSPKRKKLWLSVFACDIAILFAVWIFRLAMGTTV